MILDHASFHKSAETRKWIESCGCKILFLSPYSPDLHPIEKYGANRKTNIRDLLPSVASLSDALDLAVLSMSI
ncbi:MAG: transposase [Chlamydiales bacterium]|nr:transposase [Chlamydiales bacterium]